MLNLIPDMSENRVESLVYDIIIPICRLDPIIKNHAYIGSIYLDMNTKDRYNCFSIAYPEIDGMKFSTIEEAKTVISLKLKEKFL